MKITRFKCRLIHLPGGSIAPQPKGVPVQSHYFVALELGTDEGVEGIGISSCGDVLAGALKSAVDTLTALTVGMDPLRIEAILAKLRGAAVGAGPGGIFTTALAAIDIALWDIRGKVFGQPVWKLAGGHRERVPVYASGALMRHFPVEHNAKTATLLKKQGWKQMKTQLGAPAGQSWTPGEEVDRIARVRAAAGEDIDLMCDINQLWSVHRALDIGRRIAFANLYWLEDVVAHDDYAGLGRVNAELQTPIAGGEYVYGDVPFRHMIEARSVDIVMIDVLRSGGVTGWLKIAHMAQAFNLPVVSHLAPEIQVHLVAALPNGLTVEYMPWSVGLYEEVPVMKDGMISPPMKPGFGLKFDRKALKKYGVD